MESERDALTTEFALFNPDAPENTKVANVTALNENVARSTELRKHNLMLVWQRLQLIRKRDLECGGQRTRTNRDEIPTNEPKQDEDDMGNPCEKTRDKAARQPGGEGFTP